MRVRPDADAPPLTRSYSLSDLPDERGYRISVKRDGAGSRYLHEHVKVGDLVDVAAPRGSFVLRDGERPIVLVSAGVGATPVLAMLHALVLEHTTRPVWWLHGARDRDEHAFRAEADELLAALPEGHRFLAYSRPGTRDALGADYDIAGRLDLAALERAGVPADADYYVCGPDGFMRAVGAALADRGVEPTASRPRPSAPSPSTPPGSSPPATGRRTNPTARPAPARRSRSRAAASPPRGTSGTQACSTSPKRATSRSASGAAPACATTARAACSPAPSTTTSIPSNRPARAASSRAAPARRRS